jgi:hypothetical protein
MPPGFIRQRTLPTNLQGMPRVEIKPIGKWEETIRTIQRLSPAIKAASMQAQLKVAREIVKKVKGHLRNQDLDWRPLDAGTILAKERYGLDTRILIAHGAYYNAIEVWQKGSQHMVFAGVKKGKMAFSYAGRRRKMDIGQLAAIHEFSSGKRVPRRPLWNPTIREMGGVKGIQKMYTNSLLYHLRLKGIPVAPFKNLF